MSANIHVFLTLQWYEAGRNF